MTILKMKSNKTSGCLIPIGKSNNPLLSKKVNIHMYLHAVIITTDQNFSWSTLAINHSILLLPNNHTSCDMQSPKVGISGL